MSRLVMMRAALTGFVTKPDLLPQAADDLVRLNVNVIAAITPGAVAAARNVTTSIPIVARWTWKAIPLRRDMSRVLRARAAT